MTEDQIKHMVGRFLSWRLPENFSPDDGISPTGTNLLNADQAETMVRYMIEQLPG